MYSWGPSYKRVTPALGTFVEIVINDTMEILAQTATSRAFQELRRLEKIFSYFDPTSELFILNQCPQGATTLISAELSDLLHRAQTMEQQFPQRFTSMPMCPHGSGTCYQLIDRTVCFLGPCRFDLGGIAKGYIVDRLFTMLCDFPSVLVNAGGDIRCSSRHEIALRIPSTDTDRSYRLPLTDAAIATSSLLGHCCDIGTAAAHFPTTTTTTTTATPIASVSVIATSCVIADAFAKPALFDEIPTSVCAQFGVQSIYRFDRMGQLLHSGTS